MSSPRFALVLATAALVCNPGASQSGEVQQREGAVLARAVVTVADDFVVDVYQNGRLVPLDKRELTAEIFGATAEKMSLTVRSGDWLVFNVVQNRLRWGGSRYFGVAGLGPNGGFGFISDPSTGDWCCCDAPRDVDRFISEREFMKEQKCVLADPEWEDGASLMKERAGPAWNGDAIWGLASNCWIKFRVP